MLLGTHESRTGGIRCNRIVGEHNPAHRSRSAIERSVSSMAMMPSANTKWIGTVAHTSRMRISLRA